MTICIERVNLDTFEYLFQDIDQSKNGYKNLRKYVMYNYFNTFIQFMKMIETNWSYYI